MEIVLVAVITLAVGAIWFAALCMLVHMMRAGGAEGIFPSEFLRVLFEWGLLVAYIGVGVLGAWRAFEWMAERM